MYQRMPLNGSYHGQKIFWALEIDEDRGNKKKFEWRERSRIICPFY
jgi:hypothetical protein